MTVTLNLTQVELAAFLTILIPENRALLSQSYRDLISRGLIYETSEEYKHTSLGRKLLEQLTQMEIKL